MNNTSFLNYFDKASDLIRNDISNNKFELAGKVVIIKSLLKDSDKFNLSTEEGWQLLLTADKDSVSKAVWEIIHEGSYFKAIPLETLVDLINLSERESVTTLTGKDFSTVISMMTTIRSPLIGYEPSFIPLFINRTKLDKDTQVYANSLATLPMLGDVVDTTDIFFEVLERSSLVYAFAELFSEHVGINFTDIYTQPTFLNKTGQLELFDVGITFPPIANRIQPSEINIIIENDKLSRFGVVSRSAEILAIQHTLSQVDGIVVAFVAQGVLFNNSDKPFREFVISEKKLKEIAFLPSGTLNGAHISTAMLVFDTRGGCENVRFIDLATAGHIEKTRRNVELIGLDELVHKIDSDKNYEGIVTVSCEQIAQEDYALTAQRYALTKEQQQFDELMQKAETSELVELVSFERTPPAFNRSEKGEIPVLEVSFADMDDGYLKTPTKEILVSKRTVNEYDKSFLQPKDIIIATKGGVLGKVALVPDDVPTAGENGWVVSQFALILRLKKTVGISPEVLFIYLRSSLGQKLIARFTEGSSMPTLSLSNLKTLPVIEFSEDDQVKAKSIVEDDLKNINQIQQLKQENEKRYQSMWYLD